jgi:hypothetical protein
MNFFDASGKILKRTGKQFILQKYQNYVSHCQTYWCVLGLEREIETERESTGKRVFRKWRWIQFSAKILYFNRLEHN